MSGWNKENKKLAKKEDFFLQGKEANTRKTYEKDFMIWEKLVLWLG